MIWKLSSFGGKVLGVLAAALNATAPKSTMPLRLKRPPLRRRADRSKPRQPTIIRRKTLRSLQYLVDRDLCPPLRDSNLAVPHNLRELDKDSGTFVCENVPSYGV